MNWIKLPNSWRPHDERVTWDEIRSPQVVLNTMGVSTNCNVPARLHLSGWASFRTLFTSSRGTVLLSASAWLFTDELAKATGVTVGLRPRAAGGRCVRSHGARRLGRTDTASLGERGRGRAWSGCTANLNRCSGHHTRRGGSFSLDRCPDIANKSRMVVIIELDFEVAVDHLLATWSYRDRYCPCYQPLTVASPGFISYHRAANNTPPVTVICRSIWAWRTAGGDTRGSREQQAASPRWETT